MTGLQQLDRNIWGFNQFACKKFLGVKSSTPNIMVYGECGRFPVCIQAKVRIIKYWIRVLKMPTSRYPRQCYDMMLIYEKNGKNNWVSSLKHLLNKIGFGDVWQSQNADLHTNFINNVTQRLKDIYMQEWVVNLSVSNKCFYYRMFKSHIYREDYLYLLNIKKFRNALSRFRCSSHDLAIETGRYQKIDRINRLCRHCNLNCIEDEYHFLLVCPLCCELRKDILPFYYCVHPSNQKFAMLMKSDDNVLIRKLSTYIHKAMLLRNGHQQLP